MKHLKRFKILIPLMVMICMLFAGADTASAADTTKNFLNSSSTVEVDSIIEQHTIIEGVYEATITLNNKTSGKSGIKAHVLLIKPDAKASFKVALPGYYTEGSTAEQRKTKAWSDSDFKNLGVTNMIKEYQKAGDAKRVLAAINGDFSNATALSGNGNAPRGSVIIDGVERTHGINATDEFWFGRKAASGVMNIVQRGYQDETFEEGLTAPQYILRNGVVNGTSEEYSNGVAQPRQRSGIGIRVNGEILLISVESGVLMEQFADLMKASGCYNGVNLDGGGSINFQTDRGDGIARRTPATSEMGNYDVDENGDRLLTNALMLVADDEAVANNVGEVSGNKIETDKSEYVQGEKIYVTASSEEEGAWVGLFPADQTDVSGASKAWYYVYGGNDQSGTWCWDQGATNDLFAEACSNGPTSSAALAPGEYKVCVVDSKGVGQATAKFTIIENPDAPQYDYTLTTDKDTYEVGDPIMVSATAPTTDGTAWVGIYEEDVAARTEDPSFYWYYVHDGSHEDGGSYNLYNQTSNLGNTNLTQERRGLIRDDGTLVPGTYEVRVYGADSYTVAKNQNNKEVVKTITIVDSKTEYSITYKDGSKEIAGLTPATYKYGDVKDKVLSLPATVEKTGHIFKGWYDNADFNGDAVTSIVQGSNGNKTFYAKFDKIKYEVTFDTDGGSAIESQSVPYGDKASRPTENPTKADYNFIGWVTEDGEAYDFDQPITGATTIYASWQLAQANEHQVTFNANGGSYVESVFVEDGAAIAQPEDPIKTGYEFDKWVTADQTEYDFVNSAVTGPITLYATWTPVKYTITFDVDGGQAVENKEYTIETATFALAQTTKDGYIFKGWADAAGNTYTEIAKGSTGNLELTAQWQKKDSLAVNKTQFTVGEAIKVTAYSEKNLAWVGLYKEGHVPGTSDLSFYWSYINSNDKDLNNKEFNLIAGGNRQENDGRAFTAGTYNVILFYNDGASDYAILDSKTITIVEGDVEVNIEGKLTVSGASRTDKQYEGAADYEGSYPNYYYGDSITVKATVSGEGAENAWVGIVDDAAYLAGDYTALGTNWYWVKDFDNQEVNLSYISRSELQNTANFPERGFRWVVLMADDYTVIDSIPIFIRTYNMNWLEGEGSWGDSVKNNIKVEAEWTNKVANGEEQKPAVTITRINGHFGYDENGKEITEHVLTEGKDYTLEYPETSKEPGDYNIKVIFPTTEGTDVNYLNDPNKVKYYGLADGITYHISESANDKIITYVLNGGENHADNPTAYKVGQEIELKSPSKVLNIFGGWYTTPDFKEGTEITKITKDFKDDVTLYAKWTEEMKAEYSIKYVLNGGDNDIKNPDRHTGEADIALAPAKKAGHIFVGWFYEPTFKNSADVITKGKYVDLTVYAKFVKSSFSITTDVENGTITDGADVKNGESFTVEYAADSGYMLKSVTVDGTAVDINAYPTSYTFDKVDRDHDISVVFGKADLAAPSKLTLQLSTAKNGYDNVKVSWNKVAGAAGYRIYYKKSTASKWNTVRVSGKVTYTTKNLATGTKYNFRVVPYVKNGDNIIEAEAYKGSTITTLKKVTNVKLSRSGSKVKVSWTNIGGETGYQISKTLKKSKTSIVSTYKTTTGKSKLVKATKGKKYYYKVRAYKVVDGKKVYGPWSKVKAFKR